MSVSLGASICQKSQLTAVCPIKSRSQEIVPLTRKNCRHLHKCIKTFAFNGKCLDGIENIQDRKWYPFYEDYEWFQWLFKTGCSCQDEDANTVASKLSSDFPV